METRECPFPGVCFGSCSRFEDPKPFSQVPLEVSLTRTGGSPQWHRTYQTRTHLVPAGAGAYVSHEIDSAATASVYLRFTLRDLVPISDDWVGLVAGLEDMNGWPIGQRPAMFYRHPHDTPTYTNFLRTDVPELGSFALGLRVAR